MISFRLYRNSIYTGVALFFVGIIPLIFNLFVARTFGKEILGSINLLLSFCLLITLFITTFFGPSTNKYLAEYRGSKNYQAFKYILKIGVIGSFVTISLISCVLVWKWDSVSLLFNLNANSLIPVIIYIYCRSYYIIFRNIFYGVDLIKHYVINEVISDIIIICSLILVVFFNLPFLLLYTFILGYALFIILSLIVWIFSSKNITPISFYKKPDNKRIVISKYLNFGFTSMIGTTASTGIIYLSMLLIGYYFTDTEAGLYAAVISIANILMFFSRLISHVLLPEFSKRFGEGDNLGIIKVLDFSSLILLLFSLFSMLPMFIFAEEILSIFGTRFIEGKDLFRLILPGIFIRMISIPSVSFLSGTKYVLYPNIGGVIIFFISIISWLLFIPLYGLNGVAIGYSVGILIGIGYIFLHSFRLRKLFL